MHAISTNTANNQDNNLIDIVALLIELKKNKWLIFSVTAICLALGILLVVTKTPMYQAKALIQIIDAQPLGNVLGNNPALILAQRANNVLIQSKLIKSHTVLQPMIQSLGLTIVAKPIPTNKLMPWKKNLSAKAKIHIKTLDVPNNYKNKALKLIYDKPQHFVLYDAKNRQLIAGEVGKLLYNPKLAISINIEAIKAPPGTSFLVKKLKESQVMKKLIHAINLKEPINKKNSPMAPRAIGLLNISFQDANAKQAVRMINAVINALEQQNTKKIILETEKSLKLLHSQLPQAKDALYEAEESLHQYRANKKEPNLGYQKQYLMSQLSQINSRLAELRMKKTEVEQNYAPAHPMRIALNQNIDLLKQKRKPLENKIKLLPDLDDQGALNILRDLHIKTGLYTRLLHKIQELELFKTGMIESVQVISLPQVPDHPVPVRKKLIYSASILIGLMLSLFILLTRKLLFPRIDTPHWFEHHCNIPNLTIIPNFNKPKAKRMQASPAHKTEFSLLAYTHPQNPTIEALRQLRTNLQLKLNQENHQVIAILGIAQAVGRTFIAANLAYLLAAVGKKVLLIDGDLREGKIHQYVDLPPSPGLYELLNESKTMEQVIQTGNQNNLKILTRGALHLPSSDLIANDRCRELIKNLSRQFDIIIIDTPPLLKVTDAVLISSFATINYLVLGATLHAPSEIELAIKQLHYAGTNLNGSIFNYIKA